MNWDEIRKEYESSDLTLKALADKFGISIGTLKSRKSREGWTRDSPKKDATKKEKVATSKQKDATKKIAPKAKEILSESTLEEWEEVFCLEYLDTHNKTKSYMRARPEVAYNTAKREGSRIYTFPHIQKRLAELKEAKREQLFVDKMDIDEQWMKQAFADITDFVEFGTENGEVILGDDGIPLFDENGMFKRYKHSFVRLKEDHEVDGSVIHEVKLGREGVSLKLYDKQRALLELTKRLINNDDIKTKLLELQLEKLQAEIENLKGDKNKGSTEDWVAALKEVAEKRKQVKQNE
jgi:phage terminase small subunit